jgi:hypothetical protein
MTFSPTNPLSSPIKSISLGSLVITRPNTICQFEKIEFSESVFDLFPSGCLTVRDLDDVVTFVKGLATDPINRTIVVEYLNGDPAETFYINGVSYLNNAASQTEENFVAINFTNKLFFVNQNFSTTNLLSSYTFPQVLNIETFLETLTDKIKTSSGSNSGVDAVKLINWGNKKCSNVITYRPINPLKEKIEELSENPIQYMNYITSLACENTSKKPRFLFWTGFNNQINFKYFTENASGESTYGSYAIFPQDTPTNSAGRKKIYVFTTAPAAQYLNRQYYYIRKTPKILNKPEAASTETQEVLLINHQFLDDGKKYDIEIVTESGVVSTLSGTIGLSDLEYERKHFGYYQQNDSFTPYSNSTLLGMEYGNKNAYENKNLMGIADPYPFIDNPEMWKNMWDMTPVHPNQGSSTSGTINGPSTNLQKIYKIRNDTKTDTTKLDQIRDIEIQNFVYYVLCCLRKPVIEEEETFFACITGWEQDVNNDVTGVNDEPLVYRYRWKRIGVNLPSEITNFDNFTYPEYSPWSQMDEGSTNDINTMAINLNERKNSSEYYGPGWYAENLNEPVFDGSITYRPVGNDTGELETFKNQSSCLHIVLMRKIPYIQIILNSKNYESAIGADRDRLLEYIKASEGKYLYCFELANITDGACNSVQ